MTYPAWSKNSNLTLISPKHDIFHPFFCRIRKKWSHINLKQFSPKKVVFSAKGLTWCRILLYVRKESNCLWHDRWALARRWCRRFCRMNDSQKHKTSRNTQWKRHPRVFFINDFNARRVMLQLHGHEAFPTATYSYSYVWTMCTRTRYVCTWHARIELQRRTNENHDTLYQ